MFEITEEELINQIEELHEDNITNEGLNKFQSVGSLIEDLAVYTADNDFNKKIAFQKFLELLKGEEDHYFYKNVKESYDRVCRKLNRK
jgi:hypothetical protein